MKVLWPKAWLIKETCTVPSVQTLFSLLVLYLFCFFCFGRECGDLLQVYTETNWKHFLLAVGKMDEQDFKKWNPSHPAAVQGNIF